jgi:UDP-2,4-diacetamido-2,4,6-trideoxy-beta-L-altropyranose hydrolase
MTDILIIRADADSQIGIGHVIRCLALSQAWQERGGESIFIASRLSPALRAMLEYEGCGVEQLEARPGSKADAIETKSLAEKMAASWIVLDGYHFGTAYRKELKKSGCRLLSIDDNGHAGFTAADIVLNQNLHAAEVLYKNKEPNTRLLLGPRFCLIRRQFRNRAQADRSAARQAGRLLVVMGGGDQNNVTLRVVKAIERIGAARFQVKVVVGQTNPHMESIERGINGSDGPFVLMKNVTDMVELMAWADMAVSGAGSTCWEMAYMGLPAVVLTTFDNQQHIAKRLDEEGVVWGLGWYEAVDERTLSETIWKLALSAAQRRSMTINGMRMVDGQGAVRAVRAMYDQ